MLLYIIIINCFRFQCLEIPIVYEVYESGDCSPEYEFPPRPTLQVAHSPHHTSAAGEASDKKSSDKKGHSQSQNHSKKKGVGISGSCRSPDVVSVSVVTAS